MTVLIGCWCQHRRARAPRRRLWACAKPRTNGEVLVEQWEHGTTHVVGSTLERAATSAQSYFDIHRDARGALKRRQRARVTLRMNTCPCYSMERAANS